MANRTIILLILFPIRLLFSHVHAQDSLDWKLLKAAYEGEYLRCDSLLKAGADAEACTWDSTTALMYATDGGHIEIVALLIDSGASPLRGASIQEAPLVTAVKKGYADIARLLLAYGSDPDYATDGGATPLMYSALYNDLTLIDVLLQAGADINRSDARGRRPVHYAAESGAYEALYYFIDHGALADPDDKKNITPAMLASSYGDLPMLALLLEHGASLNKSDTNGLGIAAHAVLNGNADIAAYLLSEHDSSSGVWTKAGKVALGTGQRKLYKLIAEKTGQRYRRPVVYGINTGLSVYWNGRDHLTGILFGVDEAHTNMRLALSWHTRLGPVRVLHQVDETWYQLRERRSYFLLGIHRPLTWFLGKHLVADLAPGLRTGITYGRFRGVDFPAWNGLIILPELTAGLRYNGFGLNMGFGVTSLSQEKIKPWLFNAGVTYNIPRIKYNKYSLKP